jgi:hypothetical protein
LLTERDFGFIGVHLRSSAAKFLFGPISTDILWPASFIIASQPSKSASAEKTSRRDSEWKIAE